MDNKKVMPATVILIFLLMFPAAVAQEVYMVEMEGIVNPTSSDYIKRGLDKAIEEDAEAFIIQMDTPGGLDNSMRSIIKNILDSPVPVVTYVSPRGSRAASAGSFILVSSHIAAMAPGTNVGAAHPVGIGIGGGANPVEDKVTKDAAAYMRSLAELRGRNTDMAIEFVYNSTSLTEEEALENNIIDIIANDQGELLSKMDGMEVETSDGRETLDTGDSRIVEIPMSSREKFLSAISNPNVAYILFLAGVYGIIFELSNPGAILPGVVGGISILLALWSFSALSVSAVGIGLILFAIVLFILETQVPSYGVLAAGGIISMFLGSLFLLDIEEEPFVQISIKLITVATVITALFFLLVVGMVARTYRKKTRTGNEGMIGMKGQAQSELDPEGTVFVHGETWNGVAKSGKIDKGKKIKVVDIDSLTLIVEEED